MRDGFHLRRPLRLVMQFTVFVMVVSPCRADDAPTTAEVTYHRDVARIIHHHCAGCHHAGEGAPFSLVTYDEVSRHARLISELTASRYMPPWHAEPVDVEYRGERRLPSAEIETIGRWVRQGSPEGDSAAAPPPPKFANGWVYGTPDLVLSMPEPFVVPADGPDIYRSFAIPTSFEEDRWIRAIEFRPGVRAVVHHSFFFLDPTAAAHQKQEEDGQPGFRKMGSAVWQNSLGGWNFGGDPVTVPEGMAYRLPAGADFILQTHFHPTGKIEREASSVGIYLSENPPTRPFTSLMLPPIFGMFAGLDIPPESDDFQISDTFELPVDVEAFGVTAHAHYLGKEIRLTAQLPSGETKTLLWISDWDFGWQEQYVFEEFFPLPKGTKLTATVRYDNTSDNPLNPFDPPQRVKWGRGSNDEMGCVTLNVTPVKAGEVQVLNEAYSEYLDDSYLRVGLADAGKNQFLKTMFRRMDRNQDGRFDREERRQVRDFLKRNGLWAELPSFQPQE